jgi:D-glycero-beta-D-manno-heptose 1-phosphate adenylyltransferase
MTKSARKKIILKADDIQPIVEKLRSQGKKIVLTQGSFDMVHIGHGRYCEEAKQQGDVLIVGVDSDEKIKKRKGPDRPIVPQEERLEMMTYLSTVDYVVLKEDDAPKWHLIKLIKPDVLVATRETYSAEQIKELKLICGAVMVLDPRATTSTSAKIRRVQIGAAQKLTKTISKRLIATMEQVLEELKNGEHH